MKMTIERAGVLGVLAMMGCMMPEETVPPEGGSALEDGMEVGGAPRPLTTTKTSHVVPVDPDPPTDPGGGPPTPANLFLSSTGIGGIGAIRDLKFEKGDSPSQTPLAGYHLIPADLNRGADGTFIYLTFTRDANAVQHTNACDHAPNDFVTGIHVANLSAFDAFFSKGSCAAPGAPLTPIWEETGIGWKHPDLNDGAGGRFILAWQLKVAGGSPFTEIGVIFGSSSAIRCPFGWTKDNQDLNQGAGGDYIYFCYKQ